MSFQGCLKSRDQMVAVAWSFEGKGRERVQVIRTTNLMTPHT
jgi:hypothetical protein